MYSGSTSMLCFAKSWRNIIFFLTNWNFKQFY